jgi:DNA repair exonuclease SbcCD nuclease subunit
MIGVVSDMHLSDSIGYSSYVDDGRVNEKKEVLAEIVKAFDGCHTVVMLGDMLNCRNNSSSTIRDYVRFLESLGDRDLYVVAGNHEKYADGSASAIDFLGELRDKPAWHVVVNGFKLVKAEDGKPSMLFLPYTHKAELGISDLGEASEELLRRITGQGADILFAHHSFAGTVTETGEKVDLFNEIVLNREALEEEYRLIIGGHIHTPQNIGKTHVVGNVFASQAGEGQKRVVLIDERDFSVKSVPLVSGRSIVSLENPKPGLAGIPKNSIVRAVLTSKRTKKGMDELKEWLSTFDAYTIIERYERTRRKSEVTEGFELMPMEKKLEEYAKERKVDKKKLKDGYDLIK